MLPPDTQSGLPSKNTVSIKITEGTKRGVPATKQDRG